MGVITRIDSRSGVNNSFQLRNADGVIIASIESLSTNVKLSITTAAGIRIVKSNGAILKRKD